MPRASRLLYFLLCFCLCSVGGGAAAERIPPAMSEDILGTIPEQYGAAIAVAENYAIVGRPRSRNKGYQQGMVYLYERQADTWIEVTTLRPPTEVAHDFFGSSVAVDGEIAVVGAPGTRQGRGAAYIFERRSGVWTMVQRLKAAAGNPKDAFGQAVAIAGDSILVGAPGDDTAGQEAGAVYVFVRQQGVWQAPAVQKILASDGAAHAGFGTAMAMSETSAVVGSPAHDHSSSAHSDYGAAYVLQRQSGAWEEVARLQSSEAAPQDQFGQAVALFEQDIAIGAPRHSKRGAVYLFTQHASGWHTLETARVRGSDVQRGDRFGTAVALSKGLLLVGSYAADSNDAPAPLRQSHQGVVYSFERQTGSWHEMSRFTGSQSRLHAHFGHAIALRGEHALVGAPALLGGPDGQVYAYDGLRSNTMPQIHSAPNTMASVSQLYRYQVDASDADGDPLRYALQKAPIGMRIDALHGLVSWTPTALGLVEVEILVQDERGGVATQTYHVTVQGLNQPPHITSTPVTSAVIASVVPQISVSDAHLARQIVLLNGQPYMPGTPITTPGDYVLTVEATDLVGNTSLKILRFTLVAPLIP